ncbi:hypothetical protein FFLO_02993 [Filobasidium floriforme]|uniref:Uncharacterized protein n=2 Tax=Filobasidium floriforme TaxID=5210 RepID=A0A8K0NR90_9TREE|nr:hypothetical protein FFLO_02993 [Filobasidium floriforme]
MGYRWDPELIYWLTKGLITVGIACAFSLLALIALLLEIFCRPSYQLTNPIWFRVFSGLTTLTTIIAFVFATVLFHNGRIRFENRGIDASYGPAEWMLLSAMIVGFLSLCVGGPRFTGRHMYRADNRAVYNV